ncbi:MAG TPA: tetratricopeptide repeat protein, partial [Rhizobiales bacterium]|nr:tetratricopeptide repeat protein [Hyphomicrobiales bacterium]
GNFGVAEKHFASVQKGTLSNLTARLAHAWTLLAGGDADRAIAELDKIKKANWSQFYQYYHRGLIADVAGKREVAEKALSKAFESRPRTLRIAEAYARHVSFMGDTRRAKRILKKHIGKSAGHPISLALLKDISAGKKQSLLITSPSEGLAEVFYAIGDALTGEDSTEVGLVYLRIALYLKPDFPLANIAIGEVFDKMEKYQRAIEIYDRVPRTSPIWNRVQIRKAYDLNSLEKTDEAKALLKRLAETTPGDPRAYDALGSILRSRQRYEESDRYYTRAIEMIGKPLPRHWTLYYARGVSRERLKNWPGAEADLKMALKLSPDQPLVLNYLGYSWVDQGVNLKRAMDLIRKAVKLKPNDGYFVDSLGWAHYRLGNFQKAVQHLEHSVELRPDDPVINDHLGDAYWRVKRFLEAKYQWSQALTLEPEPEDEVKIRQKLKSGLDSPKKRVVASAASDKNKVSDAQQAGAVKDVAVLGSKPAELKKAVEEATTGRTHIVREGETLWDIANEYLGDGNLFELIYRANRKVLETPDSIRRGQKLQIPPKP